MSRTEFIGQCEKCGKEDVINCGYGLCSTCLDEEEE